MMKEAPVQVVCGCSWAAGTGGGSRVVCGLLAACRDLLCSRVWVDDLKPHSPSGSCSELEDILAWPGLPQELWQRRNKVQDSGHCGKF